MASQVLSNRIGINFGNTIMKIAFIGTGNMGGAIVRGLIKSGTCPPEDIICTAKSQATLDKLRQYDAALHLSLDNKEAAQAADIIVLAVKPWLMADIIGEIRPVVDLKRQVIVSVAASITLDELAHLFVPDNSTAPFLFRVVPNTAAEVLESVTFIASLGATEQQPATIIPPAATSLASCGIAFAMRYMRAAMEGGVELGFRPDEAARIVEHTVKGAATLLLHSDIHPEAAIDKVTTAGGITIKGLNAMERAGFTNAVIEGLKASR